MVNLDLPFKLEAFKLGLVRGILRGNKVPLSLRGSLVAIIVGWYFDNIGHSTLRCRKFKMRWGKNSSEVKGISYSD